MSFSCFGICLSLCLFTSSSSRPKVSHIILPCPSWNSHLANLPHFIELMNTSSLTKEYVHRTNTRRARRDLQRAQSQKGVHGEAHAGHDDNEEREDRTGESEGRRRVVTAPGATLTAKGPRILKASVHHQLTSFHNIPPPQFISDIYYLYTATSQIQMKPARLCQSHWCSG